MSNFKQGFIKRAEELGVSVKLADDMFNTLPIQAQQQQYMGINPRRELSPQEMQKVEQREGAMIPKVFQSLADSPAEKIYSPKTDTVLGAGAGGLVGSLLGRAVGGSEHGQAGSLIGGGAGALLAGLAANLHRKARNNDVKEQMRFLPEGATQRHYYADPLVQKGRDEAQQQLIARMLQNRG